MKLIHKIIATALIAVATQVAVATPIAPRPHSIDPSECTRGTQWDGKTVGVLGDSMTAPSDTSTYKHYYDYLAPLLGIDSKVYAVPGWQWRDLIVASDTMIKEHPDLDAVLIWAGTNDYISGCPIGEFFEYSQEEVNADGQMVMRRKRTPVMSDSTFCGRLNILLSKLKKQYPHQQIVMLTPIHRGFATFGETNVQPAECYANRADLYIDDYIRAMREAADVWSVPVIDLYTISGFYPMEESFDPYMQDDATDHLHPNTLGHYRLAKLLQYQLPTLPCVIR